MINASSERFDRAAEEALRLFRARKISEAGDAFLSILQTCPTHLAALRGFADCAAAVGNHTLAAEVAQAALDIEPQHVGTLLLLGHALILLARPTEAVAVHQRAVAADSRSAAAHMGLGLAHLLAVQAPEAHAAFLQAGALAPDQPLAAASHLYGMHYLAAKTPAEVFEAHRAWGSRFAAPAVVHDNGRDPERRLRVGYVSADFRNHAVMRFFEPLLVHHNPAQVEAFCYYNHRHHDAVTERLQKHAAGWRNILELSDDQAAALIRADGIDLLVDLTGHTADDRLMLFARKPAPLQLTWLGYPNTTGLPAMDYRITDEIADPPGAELLHTEKLLRLPAPFLCFALPPNLPPLAAPPCAAAGHITFGSFNTLVKLTPPHIATWAAILRAVGGSRLLLKSAALADAPVQQRLRARFAAGGISPDRLTLVGHMPHNTEHLALYNQVDIALDTFPYNGTTTTCEALAMGVPVVTRCGTSHHSRVGASLLTAIGHEEWIAAGENEFIAAALALADSARLTELRPRLRDHLAASPLTDAPRFARNLETAYRDIWRHWCSQQPSHGLR